MVVCPAGYLCEFRASEFREIAEVRAGHHVHPVLALLLRVEHVLEAAALAEHLPGQGIPCPYEQASHPRYAHQCSQLLPNAVCRPEGCLLDDPVGLGLADVLFQGQIDGSCREDLVLRMEAHPLGERSVLLEQFRQPVRCLPPQGIALVLGEPSVELGLETSFLLHGLLCRCHFNSLTDRFAPRTAACRPTLLRRSTRRSTRSEPYGTSC